MDALARCADSLKTEPPERTIRSGFESSRSAYIKPGDEHSILQLMDKLRLEVDALLNSHFRRVEASMLTHASKVHELTTTYQEDVRDRTMAQEKASGVHEKLLSQQKSLELMLRQFSSAGFMEDVAFLSEQGLEEGMGSSLGQEQKEEKLQASSKNAATTASESEVELKHVENFSQDAGAVQENAGPENADAEQRPKRACAVARDASKALTDEEREKILGELGPLARMVLSQRFETTSASVIMLNALFVGVQAEYNSWYMSDNAASVFLPVSYVFSAFFIVELTLRGMVFGIQEFLFHADDRAWNRFDAVVVCMCIVDVVIDSLRVEVTELESISMLRMIRTLRILRLLRVIRLFRFFRELRMMVTSIVGCVKSLMWAVVLLFFMLYVFGVMLSQGVVTFCQGAEKCQADEYVPHRQYYGSVFRSIFTLYKAMSGGADWGDPAQPLSDVGPLYVLLYVCFITFATIAIMNIVTGVFVEVAMTAAQSDRDAMIQDKAFKQGEYLESLRSIFREIDDDDDGVMTLQELETNIADPRLRSYLEALDMDVSDIQTLHMLCDLDGEGNVDIDEFIGGCSRLKGQASAMDLAIFKRMLTEDMTSIRELIEARFNELRPQARARGTVKAAAAPQPRRLLSDGTNMGQRSSQTGSAGSRPLPRGAPPPVLAGAPPTQRSSLAPLPGMNMRRGATTSVSSVALASGWSIK